MHTPTDAYTVVIVANKAQWVMFMLLLSLFNPLTPMLAVTRRDEHWPLFHF